MTGHLIIIFVANNYEIKSIHKKVKWNDMNKTKGSAKGFCFYVFLDKNMKSQKPAPTGKITIYYYISGTGAFNAKLDF